MEILLCLTIKSHMPTVLIYQSGDDFIISDKCCLNDLTAELSELESEAKAIRRRLGGKRFDGHSDSYRTFRIIKRRISEIKHILMLYGHIP